MHTDTTQRRFMKYHQQFFLMLIFMSQTVVPMVRSVPRFSVASGPKGLQIGKAAQPVSVTPLQTQATTSDLTRTVELSKVASDAIDTPWMKEVEYERPVGYNIARGAYQGEDIAPFELAIYQRDFKKMKKLFDQGEVSVQNIDFDFMQAAKNRDLQMANTLLEIDPGLKKRLKIKGAYVGLLTATGLATWYMYDKQQKKQKFKQAVDHNDVEVVRQMIQGGLVDAQMLNEQFDQVVDQADSTMIQLFLESDKISYQTFFNALDQAAQRGNDRAFQAVIAADVGYRSKQTLSLFGSKKPEDLYGTSSMADAVRQAFADKNYALIDCLIKHKLHTKTFGFSIKKRFNQALDDKDYRLVNILLENKVFQQYEVDQLLQQSAKNKDFQLVDMLLEHRAYSQKIIHEMLYEAIIQKNENLIQLLAQHQAYDDKIILDFFTDAVKYGINEQRKKENEQFMAHAVELSDQLLTGDALDQHIQKLFKDSVDAYRYDRIKSLVATGRVVNDVLTHTYEQSTESLRRVLAGQKVRGMTVAQLHEQKVQQEAEAQQQAKLAAAQVAKEQKAAEAKKSWWRWFK